MVSVHSVATATRHGTTEPRAVRAPTGDDEDITYFFEADEDGWVLRQVELQGPERMLATAASLSEWPDADADGLAAVQQYEARYGGLADQTITSWDADLPHEAITQRRSRMSGPRPPLSWRVTADAPTRRDHICRLRFRGGLFERCQGLAARTPAPARAWKNPSVATYVLRLIAPRPDFALTLSEEERDVMGRHAAHWQRYIDSGQMVVFGPVLDGTGSWGLGVIESENEDELRAHAANDPVVTTRTGTIEIGSMLFGHVRASAG